MSRKILAEALNGCGILALGGEDHLALVKVHKQADVIVPAALGGLIHPTRTVSDMSTCSRAEST